ncbi:MlaD family protein [Gordonia hankookensis]|uniref:MCE family protein n=1 Tax=Gordonia hankookensis TaxID=589403 RepID=A0ABR7W9M7_9ACTN|nr:MCE family protein [Gordonia hankookensis]MBD1319510.1 MCE family protein [Gordonia hankookensis]
MNAPSIYDAGPHGLSNRQLLISGIIAIAVIVAVLAAIALKSGGTFTPKVPVTAQLADVGDGLPVNSDVKYRGVIVGTVTGVTPAITGPDNTVDISIAPDRAPQIPRTVTARVVPSNVFAVSSVQLIDNGSAPAIASGDVISQDTNASTVQFQTALSKLRAIVSATARAGSDRTVGMLAAVATATDRRGSDISRAGAQLDRIVGELDRVVAPDGGPSTLRSLSSAVTGLRKSAPDLLDALHSSVGPMQTVARESGALSDLLGSGIATTARVNTALERNTAQIIRITGQAAPVASVVADGSAGFTSIVMNIGVIADKWFSDFWPAGLANGRGKFLFQFTPHKLYTRADCPRYGNLQGASCSTAPSSVSPPVLKGNERKRVTAGYQTASMGGNVGSVGSADEQATLGKLVGGGPNSANTLILGPVARGESVTVSPDVQKGAP